MSFKSWRERMRLSQERVSVMSGLSLRTVQRLEAGHRVSYASLRALAAAFETDVDLLERELYAVNKPADEFVEIPRWVRLLSDKLWFGGPRLTRRDFFLIEAFCIACALVALAASLLVSETARASVASMSAIPLACCYLTALAGRVLDRYRLRPGAENAPPERPRTWRSVTAEYGFLLAVGFLGIATIAWLAV